MRAALRRTTTCLTLAVVLPLLPTPTGASAADPAREAGKAVAAMQAEVDRTAAQLTAGTRRLERSRAELTGVQRRLTRAQRDAAAAKTTSDVARDRLRLVIAAAYKSPVPDSFVLALSGPDQFQAAMVAQGDLLRVRGRQADLLRSATAERVRAQSAVRTVEQLSADAGRRQKDLAGQVARLSSAARTSEKRLKAAASRLSAMQTRVSRARSVSLTVADCDGGGGGRTANGFLSQASLCPLAGAPGQSLRADAAASFNRMTAAAQSELGSALCVTDSYRSYGRQVSVYARKPNLAAVPGTSRHGYGVALDLGCGVQRFGSSAYRWMKANGPRFGWVHPGWAEPGGGMPEPWHWEYVG